MFYMDALFLSFVHLKNLKAINDLSVATSASEVYYKFAFGLNFSFAVELENLSINSIFVISVFLLRIWYLRCSHISIKVVHLYLQVNVWFIATWPSTKKIDLYFQIISGSYISLSENTLG